MVMRRHAFRSAAVGGHALVVIGVPAHAQSVNVLDSIVRNSRHKRLAGKARLPSLPCRLSVFLAAIELAWSAFRLAFRGADVSEWLAEIVNQILFLGFLPRAACRTPSRGARRSSTASGRPDEPRVALASPRPRSSLPA